MPPDRATLAQRLTAVERALVDRDAPEGLAEPTELATRVEALEQDLEAITEQVLLIEAGVRALRGYAAHVEHVNRDVEQQAAMALAAVEAIDGDRRSVSRAERRSAGSADDRRAEAAPIVREPPDEESEDQRGTLGHRGAAECSER